MRINVSKCNGETKHARPRRIRNRSGKCVCCAGERELRIQDRKKKGKRKNEKGLEGIKMSGLVLYFDSLSTFSITRSLG
jgi:hypothetical protein